jgi:hypothetical protein
VTKVHIALLGDSTFDNAPYTEGGPDVVTHLNRLLVPPDRATLLALDGAVMEDVYGQIEELRELTREGDGPTHVALSVGGNDLLGEVDLLERHVGNVAEALSALREEAVSFGTRYWTLLDALLNVGLPTVICTVYNGAFDDPEQAFVIETAMCVFDHEILVAGLDRGLPVVDLRRVCSSRADYFNPIEPSELGGSRIAAAVLAAFRAPRYDVGGRPMTLQGTGGLAR